jgi:flavin-dependent dehydrogenase
MLIVSVRRVTSASALSAGANALMLERVLTLRNARFVCEGLPALASLRRGVAGIASLQWSISGGTALVGDAAIARDALSSQGLTASLSDALYAVAAIDSNHLQCLRLRQVENLSSHLRLLREQIARCQYSARPLWQAYDRFIAERIGDFTHSRKAPALRSGRLEELPTSHLADKARGFA